MIRSNFSKVVAVSLTAVAAMVGIANCIVQECDGGVCEPPFANCAELEAFWAKEKVEDNSPEFGEDTYLAQRETLNCGGNGGNGGAEGGSGGVGGTGSATGGNLGGGGTGTGGGPQCVNDVDCTDADNAQCNNGTCVPCTTSPHCEGVPGLPACDAGTCVECLLGDEDACISPQTCDLLAKECVAVSPMSVTNCRACTNDVQCAPGHRCIPMEFEGSPHGHYCLKEDTGGSCTRPFSVFINQPSISQAAAVNYCGIEEDLATCEAVHALLQGWVCETGMTDGMCGPSGMPEVAVPGALCKQVGGLANQCTYGCAGAIQCPNIDPQNTCGTGGQLPPGWCGG